MRRGKKDTALQKMQSVANAELVFIIIIIILHGEIAVDDISAFICYILHFFYELDGVFSPLCLSHYNKKKEQRKERKKNLKQT